MRKEVFWAIIAGIFLGLIVAFGVYRINSNISKNKKDDGKIATATTKPTTPDEFKIVLDKPEDNDVVTQDIIEVSGLTKPLSWITVSGENEDYIIQSDNSGVFSQNVKLIPGINQIKVTAFESSGQKSATGVLVVYSSSFQIKTLPTDSPNGQASVTGDVRQKVAQEVANTVNRPKAYIGTVTDITDSTVEIKSTSSDISQISINTETVNVVNSTGTTSKTVKTTDIAIGDFIVAMGYIGANSVLTAQRILITNAVTEPKISVSQGKIEDIPKKQINTNTDILSYKDGKTSAVKLTNIEDSDTIIYVVTTDSKDTTSVRSIFVIL